jgi:hypothetical protein
MTTIQKEIIMTFSMKRFNEVYLGNGDLDKNRVMQTCVDDFQICSGDITLNELSPYLKNNLVYSNMRWEGNYRLKANADLSGIDVILLDIDNGMKIDEVLALPFNLMCLTTTSHTVEKPKFRVFLPLLEPISLNDNQEYKELMGLISKTHFHNAIDASTMEIGRAYITTTRAESFVNNSTEKFDANALLVTVRQNIKFEALARELKNSVNNNIQTRPATIEEVLRYPKVKNLISEFGEGNHYKPVFQIMGISKKAGLSDHDTVSLIMKMNIGGEYSNYDSLMKKVERYAS